MIWPGPISDKVFEVVVLENIASIGHLLFGFLIVLAGCAREGFALYTAYQASTTIVKTLLFPEHTLADWSWDLLGDVLEFSSGAGLAFITGLDVASRNHVFARYCTVKALLAASRCLA